MCTFNTRCAHRTNTHVQTHFAIVRTHTKILFMCIHFLAWFDFMTGLDYGYYCQLLFIIHAIRAEFFSLSFHFSLSAVSDRIVLFYVRRTYVEQLCQQCAFFLTCLSFLSVHKTGWLSLSVICVSWSRARSFQLIIINWTNHFLFLFFYVLPSLFWKRCLFNTR